MKKLILGICLLLIGGCVSAGYRMDFQKGEKPNPVWYIDVKILDTGE